MPMPVSFLDWLENYRTLKKDKKANNQAGQKENGSATPNDDKGKDAIETPKIDGTQSFVAPSYFAPAHLPSMMEGDLDARRMLADLGTARRDAVSAPAETSKGRDYRQDPREQAAVAAAFEARRKADGQSDLGGSEDRKTVPKAWYKESTFERDERISQLENRWSGQGHRAELTRKLNQPGRNDFNHDDLCEAFDTAGEERRLYLQEHPTILHKAYGTHKTTPSKQDRFREHVLKQKASPPRKVFGGRLPNGRHAASSPQTPAHARAPSPRRFGTVHFGPGYHRTRDNANGLPSITNPGTGPAPALLANLMKSSPVKQTSLSSKLVVQHEMHAGHTMSGPGSLVTAAFPAPVNGAHSQKSLHTSNGQHAAAGVTGAPAVRSSGLQLTATPARDASQPRFDQVVQEKSPTPAPKNAAAQATTPRSTNSPQDTAPPAVCRNLALWYAANPGKACDDYHESNPNRLQYLGPARDQLVKEVISLAGLDHEKRTREYLETHKERDWMVDAAKEAKRQVEEDSDEQIRDYCRRHPRQPIFIRAAMAVFTPNRPDVFAHPEKTMENPLQSVPSSPGEDIPAESQHSTPDSPSDLSDGSSTTAESTCSSPPLSKIGGMLSATFWDVADNFLGVHQVRLDAPVLAKITVTSRAQGYNPRKLISGIEAIVQSMLGCSLGLQGVRLTDDGLWVDDDEEL